MMATLNSNGRVLQYSDTGGSGLPVILAHGYFLDEEMFSEQARALPPQFRVITWDARGHGGTADDGEPFTYWDSARDLLGLMDALGIDSAVCGGVSQGGFISLRAALLAPQRMAGLVLFDTEAQACSPGDQQSYRQLFSALSAAGPTDDLVIPLARQLIGNHPAALKWIGKWRAAEQMPLGAPAECLIKRDDIVDRLGEVTCPVLLARGSEDGSLPASRLDTLHEHLPAASVVHSIPGAWHSPPLTHPEAVNPLLLSFLSGLAPR
jgi:pimeloyl-ACP methyl ester carboxylesterase